MGGTPSDLSHRSVRKGMFGFHKNELPQNFLGCLKKVTHYFHVLLVVADHNLFDKREISECETSLCLFDQSSVSSEPGVVTLVSYNL